MGKFYDMNNHSSNVIQARPPHNDLFKPPWRVFLVSGNKKIVQSAQE